MRALLDVNVWIALLDDAHQFSAEANEFIEHPDTSIATCPLVENGVIRVMNVPRYANRGPLGIARVRDRLSLACDSLDHEFWSDAISLRDSLVVNLNRIQGHNQITDLYLLALAVHNGGCLATFDQGVALSAVNGAEARHLKLL